MGDKQENLANATQKEEKVDAAPSESTSTGEVHEEGEKSAEKQSGGEEEGSSTQQQGGESGKSVKSDDKVEKTGEQGPSSNKPRSRSGSLNKNAAQAKEWKPKGSAETGNPNPTNTTQPRVSQINADAPPFVSSGNRHHQQQLAAQSPQAHVGDSVNAEEGQETGKEDAAVAGVKGDGSHPLQTPWSFWFSRKPKKGRGGVQRSSNDNGGDGEKEENAGGKDESGDQNSNQRKAGGAKGEKEIDNSNNNSNQKGRKKKGQQQQQQQQNNNDNQHRGVLSQLGTVHTVEDFWATYCYLQRPSALPKDSNYYLFRNKLEPMWETFPKGGCFIVRVKKGDQLNKLWEELLFAAIGEIFEDPAVVGVVVSIRSKEDALSVWMKTTALQLRARVSEKLKEILELDKNAVLGYKTNISSIRDKSTYKNAKKILLVS